MVPVAQEYAPRAQGSAAVQLPLAVHATQLPPLQTRSVPQVTPLASAVPLSLHTGAPVLQAMVPLWHALPDGVQVAPAVHATQVPPPQTRPVPQAVPLLTLAPVSTQTDAPVLQSVAPVWQGLPDGVQVAPAVHATQAPALHTRPAPQLAPLARLVPVSVHTGVPVRQSVVPVWQALPAGVQLAPATQALQTPPPHTRPVPQEAPSATLVPLSVQVAPDAPHTRVPTWQGLLATQLPPPTHGAQAPLRHVPPTPQAVPSDAFMPVSMQEGAPAVHTMAPR
jgi:hypothetical protein